MRSLDTVGTYFADAVAVAEQRVLYEFVVELLAAEGVPCSERCLPHLRRALVKSAL